MGNKKCSDVKKYDIDNYMHVYDVIGHKEIFCVSCKKIIKGQVKYYTLGKDVLGLIDFECEHLKETYLFDYSLYLFCDEKMPDF